MVDREVQKLLDRCYSEAKQILVDNRSLLDEVSLYLLNKETITGEELMVYVNSYHKRLEAPQEPDVLSENNDTQI